MPPPAPPVAATASPADADPPGLLSRWEPGTFSSSGRSVLSFRSLTAPAVPPPGNVPAKPAVPPPGSAPAQPAAAVYLRMSNPEVFQVPEQVVRQLLADLPEQVVAHAGASHPVPLEVSYEQGDKGPICSFRLSPELISALEADSGLSVDLNSVLSLRRLTTGSGGKQSDGKAGSSGSRRSARGDGGGGSVQLGMRLVPRSEFGRLDGPIIDPWETAGYRKRTYSRAHGSRAVQPATQRAAAAAHGSGPALPAVTEDGFAAMTAAIWSKNPSGEAAGPAASAAEATAATTAAQKQHPAAPPAAQVATSAKAAGDDQVRLP